MSYRTIDNEQFHFLFVSSLEAPSLSGFFFCLSFPFLVLERSLFCFTLYFRTHPDTHMCIVL